MKSIWPYVLAAALLLSACEKHRLDQQVKELCAKDGGVRVYETVRLPADRFDKWGLVKLYSERQEIKGAYRNDAIDIHKEHTLGSEYVLKMNIHYFRTGNPAMLQYRTQVFRLADGKLLGETVSYGRGGGDLPGPWEPSNFHCPPTSESSEVVLLKKLFTN